MSEDQGDQSCNNKSFELEYYIDSECSTFE